MIIENSKTYNVNDVENLFFRPSFCGKSAEELGIRILYNMPIPTNIPVFSHHNNILQEFSSGWHGSPTSNIDQKEITLSKLKAESSYSAESYFSTIYEMLTNSAEVNLGDLTGTDLEAAETELFRRAIVDSIYSTMWWGDTNAEYSNFTSFTGFLPKIELAWDNGDTLGVSIETEQVEVDVESILADTWGNASTQLRNLASDGHLAFYVTSDIYDKYRTLIDQNNYNVLNAGVLEARPTLYYHGIPLVEIPMDTFYATKGKSFCLLTDRRNLILGLNTNDSPEKGIKMWYNPDEMENRQRVVFLAGTLVADKDIVAGAIFHSGIVF